MIQDELVIEIVWNGPYGWPQFEIESNLPPIPKLPGVYLQTVEYQNGYLIYAAGLIIVKNNCAVMLHGLPQYLEI